MAAGLRPLNLQSFQIAKLQMKNRIRTASFSHYTIRFRARVVALFSLAVIVRMQHRGVTLRTSNESVSGKSFDGARVGPGPAEGLSEAEAKARLTEYGYNEIREEPSGPLRGILKRLWGPIPWMLEAALILEVVLGKVTGPALIAVWLLFSAVLGGLQERRARTALDLLRSRLQVTSRVRRAGNWQIFPAREIVPGDQVHVRMGDIVPADLTIQEGTVEVDQSALTGDSGLVPRSPGETIYSASTVRRGEATGTVTATGSRSYYGRTAELVRTARSVGHLDQLLFTVVRYLVSIDAVLAAVLVAAVLWSGADLLPLIPFFLVLVIATVPVTMPVTARGFEELTGNAVPSPAAGG